MTEPRSPNRHPTINSRLADLRWVVGQGRPPKVLAEAAAAMFEQRVNDADQADMLLKALLPLLKHESPIVRLGAIHGLRAHPYPAALQGLYVLADKDPAPKVKKAAQEALAALESSTIECLQCGCAPAKLALEEDANPHSTRCTKPMFCDERCATKWALERAAEEHHPCVLSGEWHVGSEGDCDECLANAWLGVEKTETART